MNDIESKIQELSELKNSLIAKSASLDSSLLSMDKYLIANLRVKLVKTAERIDSAIVELNTSLQVMKNNKKWD